MNRSGLVNTTCMGGLTIGSVSLHTPAWKILDLMPLWASATLRGEDRVVPGIEGILPFGRRATATTKTLMLEIIGGVDHTGTPFTGLDANPYKGMWTNFEYLHDNVAAPVGGDGTRSATLVMPDGSTRNSRVTVLSLTPGDHAGLGMLAALDISIPSGRFN